MEHLEVLLELHFLYGCWLRVSTEDHDRCGEVLGGPFGKRSSVNVIDHAAAYFLCKFARRCGRGIRTECMVEPCLLVLKSPPSLVELVKEGMLPFAIVLGSSRLFAGEASGKVGSPSAKLSSERVEGTTSVLTMYFGTPSMFITLWFGFVYELTRH
jgi:hypothetical protein